MSLICLSEPIGNGSKGVIVVERYSVYPITVNRTVICLVKIVEFLGSTTGNFTTGLFSRKVKNSLKLHSTCHDPMMTTCLFSSKFEYVSFLFQI